MPRYSFMLSGEVVADDEKEATEKIRAGVGFEEVDIEDGPDELPEEEIDEEETQP